MESLSSRLKEEMPKSVLQRALDYGIDLSLLEENLRLSPLERMRRYDEAFVEFLQLQKKS